MGFYACQKLAVLITGSFASVVGIFAKEQKYRFSGYSNGGVITSLTLALLKENST